MTKCPKCGLSRWKIANNSNKKKCDVPGKQMWYFPIVPRFIRMFKRFENAKNLRWHTIDRKVDGILRHPTDTPSRRLIDHMWPTFGLEPRNLRFCWVLGYTLSHGTWDNVGHFIPVTSSRPKLAQASNEWYVDTCMFWHEPLQLPNHLHSTNWYIFSFIAC